MSTDVLQGGRGKEAPAWEHEDTGRYRTDDLEPEPESGEDTVQIEIGGNGAAVETDASRRRAGTFVDGSRSGPVHPYAQGVIRYYRARTVLLAERGPTVGAVALRAWGYLRSVEPRHLPPVVRHAHLELTHLVLHEIDLSRSLEEDAVRFFGKVSAIAGRIDEIVDDLLTQPG